MITTQQRSARKLNVQVERKSHITNPNDVNGVTRPLFRPILGEFRAVIPTQAAPRSSLEVQTNEVASRVTAMLGSVFPRRREMVVNKA